MENYNNQRANVSAEMLLTKLRIVQHSIFIATDLKYTNSIILADVKTTLPRYACTDMREHESYQIIPSITGFSITNHPNVDRLEATDMRTDVCLRVHDYANPRTRCMMQHRSS